MENSKIIKGWLVALFCVTVLWGINNNVLGYAAKVLEVNYLVYCCCAFLSASLVLLYSGGLKDDLARETLRSPHTFVFGILMLVVSILTLALFNYMTSTEGALLQRISMVFALLMAWIFMQRKPTKSQIVGNSIVLIGIAYMLNSMSKDNIGLVLFILFLLALSQTTRVFVSENHNTYNKAVRKEQEDSKLQIRIVGFVIFVVSVVFLIFSFLFALLQTYYPIFEYNRYIPNISDFTDYATIFSGFLAGVLFVAPIRLSEFYSASTIKAENFLAVGAFSGVATLFWEWALSPLTGLSLKELSVDIIIAGIIITAGCLYIALSQILRVKKHGPELWRDYVLEYDKDDIHAYHSKDIVNKALHHYDNNKVKAAEALGISLCTINKLQDEDGYAFRDIVSSSVMANFKENIANIDYLTKIANRSGFKAIGEEFIASTDLFTLMFIDLDKFKPINDTYGHDIGDEVLMEISKRLKKLETEDIRVARLAGDEFVVLFRNYEKSHLIKHLAGFERIIDADIHLTNNKVVNVEASIGLAEYDTDAKSLDEMLDYADKKMYKHKHNK
tara:strand:- start:348 stop:2024 length:1677 start_codon:yes stop_codon:yes gene_type:complete